MASPDVLDFAKLLAPIPGDSPVGTDLRANTAPSSPYYLVKDARSAARAAERQMEGGLEDPPPPDWKAVVNHATKALAANAKDLEIAAYLVEALCRTNGFAGLRDGFKLTKGLVEQYWDTIFPLPDEEGVSTKVAPVTGLNGDDSEGTLIAPINRVPITDGSAYGRLTYSNYLQAVATEKIADPKAKEKKIAAGALHMEIVQKSVDESSATYYRNLYDDIVAAQAEFAALNTILDSRAGSSSPPNSAIRNALTNVLDAVNDIGRVKLAATVPTETKKDEAAKPEDEKAGGKEAGKEGGKAEGNGKPAVEEQGEKLPVLRNRSDALSAILQIGEYFRRNEPSSLVPFVLEQAVRWARMPLPDLLTELIPDEGPRKALFKQAGIRAMEAGAMAAAATAAAVGGDPGSVPSRTPKNRAT